MSAECCWCGHPVTSQGDTCCFGCYAAWHAWVWTNRETGVYRVGATGVLVSITESEIVPFDLTDQPWYADAIEGNERREPA